MKLTRTLLKISCFKLLCICIPIVVMIFNFLLRDARLNTGSSMEANTITHTTNDISLGPNTSYPMTHLTKDLPKNMNKVYPRTNLLKDTNNNMNVLYSKSHLPSALPTAMNISHQQPDILSGTDMLGQNITKTIVITNWTPRSMSATLLTPWFQQQGLHSMEHCYTHHLLDWGKMPCEYTNNRMDLNRSDAVLFRARRLPGLDYLPPRTPHQKWIVWEFEPPYKVMHRFKIADYNGLFNLTSMFTRDSDIVNRGWHHCEINSKKLLDYSDINFAKQKRNDVLVAWFVSICRTEGRREDYVRELKKHIAVDIYGGCGRLRCGSNVPMNWPNEKCEERLLHGNNSYKFYLSFENSLCIDYVTEKLWKVMPLDIVPIVMGGGNYSSILPTGTYIDAKDYPNPKDMADFILKLNQSETLYNQYVSSKKALDCTEDPKLPLQCQICKRLHELKGQVNIVKDLASFWGHSKCLTPSQYFNSTNS